MICRGPQHEVGEDPVLDAYLEFLADQMQAQPHLIRGLSSLERAEALVEGIEVDPDEDLGHDAALSATLQRIP
jgi:hypothetical protein